MDKFDTVKEAGKMSGPTRVVQPAGSPFKLQRFGTCSAQVAYGAIVEEVAEQSGQFYPAKQLAAKVIKS